MDSIRISELSAQVVIGVWAAERQIRQPVKLSIELFGHWGQAAHTDQLDDAVDYSLVHQRICQLLEQSQSHLLEHLAAGVIDCVLACDQRILRVQCEITKPWALPGDSQVTLCMARDRQPREPD